MLNLTIDDPQALERICHALSTRLRLDIVRLLNGQSLSCLEVGRQLGYPLSTISNNVKILEDAGLVLCERLPAKNGSKKVCSLVYRDISVLLAHQSSGLDFSSRHDVEIPIGNYMDFEVHPSCGLVGENGELGQFDLPEEFFSPQRIGAQLIWFRKGFVEYRIPLHASAPLPKSIAFEMEICSEAPGFNSKWRSDICLWINGVEVGTWTSPADFGDRRGRFTPSFWGMGNTQYGQLTRWEVDEQGCAINGQRVGDVRIDALALGQRPYVSMRIGVKEDARHAGGVNIFGNRFGDYAQGIHMCICYKQG